MLNPVSFFFHRIADLLAEFRVIDEHRGQRIADLTWPRFLTMFARKSQRAADISMVGLTIGPTAIAGLAFANLYWRFGYGLVLGLTGGTISQISQRFGAERYVRLDLAVKQSVWGSVILVLPFALLYWAYAEPLIALLGADPATVTQGAMYLRVLSLAFLFGALNLVSSRTLAGSGDTWIAMSLRSTGAFVNIVFNAIFIFGLDMGVRGAALGTVIAEGVVTGCFVWGFVYGHLPVVGEFPVQISLNPPYFDLQLSRQLLTITVPLMVRSLARTVAAFPLFAILSVFGPVVVAAFEVGRRVRSLMSAPGSGFSMSASSLVGQELGQGNEPEAGKYGWDVLQFSAVLHVVTAGIILAFSRQITHLFVEEPTAIEQTIPFIQIAAISLVGTGVEKTFTGVLKAAGDNRWSMYGMIFGQYIALLPLTYLGSITSLGVIAVYFAMIAETWSAGLITGYRFMTGSWKETSRSYRPEAPAE